MTPVRAAPAHWGRSSPRSGVPGAAQVAATRTERTPLSTPEHLRMRMWSQVIERLKTLARGAAGAALVLLLVLAGVTHPFEMLGSPTAPAAPTLPAWCKGADAAAKTGSEVAHRLAVIQRGAPGAQVDADTLVLAVMAECG